MILTFNAPRVPLFIELRSLIKNAKCIQGIEKNVILGHFQKNRIQTPANSDVYENIERK